MLSLSSEFTKAFGAANVEPVLLVEIYTTTADSGSVVFCTGSRTLDFAGIYNPFSGGTTPAKTAAPSVAAVSPLALAIDPFERTIARTNVSITFHDDGALRALIASTQLLNKSITIKLGTHEIEDESDWAPVYRGVISGTKAREGQIDLTCADAFHFLSRPYRGTWFGRHPLEGIKKLLEDCGTPASLIDSASFDFTDSAYAGIAHYVSSTLGRGAGFRFNPMGFQVLPGETSDTFTRAHDLARAMVGGLYVQEDGRAGFKRFDKTAATVAHWTVDDIGSLQHVQTIFANEIEVSVTSNFWAADDTRTDSISVVDSDAQTAHSFPGTSTGVEKRTISFDINSVQARSNLFAGTGAQSIGVQIPYAISGTRVAGTYVSPGSWAALQTSGTELSAARPLYVKIDDEVIKCESLAFVDGYADYPAENDADGRTGTSKDLPRYVTLTVGAGERGQLGTTAAAHITDDYYREPHKQIVDVTMMVDFAHTQLERFSNGAPIIEVTTNLAQWGVQLGELVSVDSDVFLFNALNGLSSAVKFEVVGKELRLDDGNASIKWTLAYATRTSAPVPTKAYKYPKGGGNDAIGFITDAILGDGAHVGYGLEVATVSGLDISVGDGVAGTAIANAPFWSALNFTLPASKDVYVDFDAINGNPTIAVQTIGANAPALGTGCVRLAKVVTGASSVSSVSDYRNFGTIKPRDISPDDFEAGGNLLFNPDFEAWSKGGDYPPDLWVPASGTTWATDAAQESEERNKGRYALKIGGDNKTVYSEPVRVEAGRVYDFGAAAVASDSGLTVQAGVQWLTGAKANISTDYAINDSGLTVWTNKHVGVAAPSTAEFARAVLTRGAVAASGPELLLRFDNNLNDSSGNGHICTGTNITYNTSGAGGTGGAPGSGLGFNQSADFTGSSYIDFPALGLGTSDLTIEWWAKHDNSSLATFHWGFANNHSVYFKTFLYGGNQQGAWLIDGSNNAFWLDVQSGVGNGNWYDYDSGTTGSAWRHFALTRKDMGSGVSQWDLYFSGRKCTVQNYSSYQPQDPAPPGLWAPTNITLPGRIGGAGPNYGGSFRGDFDDFAFYKSVEYSGSTYTIPTAPIALSAGASEAYFDSTRLVRSQASFRAKQTVAQATIADKSAADIEFNTEDHDVGGQFDSTTDFDFTAKFDGVYEFEARVAATLTNPQTDAASNIILLKNAATLTKGSYSHEDDGTNHLMFFHISSGPVKLAAGDTVAVNIYNSSGRVITIRNDGDLTWFAGRQVS